MAETGQQQPIIVAEVGKDQFLLVAGAHRLEAAKLLKWKTIVAVLAKGTPEQLRLVEIDENLARRNLSALDRAIALGERKRIYEELYPETKQGGDRKSTANPAEGQNDTMSFWSASPEKVGAFSTVTAEKLGIERRTVERAVRIAAALSPELRENLTGHPIADNQAQLLKLVKLPPEQREKAVAALTREEAPAKTVQEAVEATAGRVKTKERPAHQKQYDALCRAFDGANARAKKLFITWLHENGALDAVIATATRTEEAE